MSHRGFWGGNVIQNTRQAALVAVKAGADIVEVDICRSSDGVYYLFHKHAVRMLLNVDKEFEEMTSKEIDHLTLLNSNALDSGYHVEKLESFIDWLPITYILNIDRSWDYWDDPYFFRILEKSGKKKQFILKSPAKVEFLEKLNNANTGIAFMPISFDQEDFNRVEEYENIDLVGIDMRIDYLNNHPLLESKWLNRLLSRNMLIVANSEHLGSEFRMFDVLDDTAAIVDSETYVWDIMLKYGINVIKTDWPNFVNDYRERLVL
ncbi:glycerophosphodiester phosphodiesterase family protein [Aerococcaceae bacterium WGS1372]